MSHDIYDFLDGGDYDNDFDGESRNRFPPIYHVINDALNLDISNPGFKISVQEMYLDQKRVMKNYVKDFYYVKQEDIEQIKDFQINHKGTFDISSLIIDEYEFEV